MVALGAGGGLLDLAMLVGITVPGGQVIVVAVGAGVGAYELGRLAAGFVRDHETEIRHGLVVAGRDAEAAGAFAATHPEIDPMLAAAAALAAHHDDIVAAGAALGHALEHDAAHALRAGAHIATASLSAGVSVVRGVTHLIPFP